MVYLHYHHDFHSASTDTLAHRECTVRPYGEEDAPRRKQTCHVPDNDLYAFNLTMYTALSQFTYAINTFIQTSLTESVSIL